MAIAHILHLRDQISAIVQSLDLVQSLDFVAIANAVALDEEISDDTTLQRIDDSTADLSCERKRIRTNIFYRKNFSSCKI